MRILLEVGGHSLRVAQVGENSLILRDVLEMGPADANVVITVDGKRRVHPVRLRDGISGRVVFFENGIPCQLDS